MAFESGLEPGKVRKVCARIQRGAVMVGPTAELLKSRSGTSGQSVQAIGIIALLAAIDKLKAADSKTWGTSAYQPVKRFVRRPATSIQLDLTAYWP